MVSYQPTYDASRALIVGIEEYEHLPPLITAVRGANAVAELLHNTFGFKTTTLFNGHATRESILHQIKTMRGGPDDRVLFYFAGHGITRRATYREIGYLALPASLPDDTASMLNVNEMIDALDGLPAKHVLLLFDACLDGLTLTERSDLYDLNDTRAIADTLRTTPTRYAIVSGHSEAADDRDAPGGLYSFFTYSLLRGLRGDAPASDGLLRASELGVYLENQVSRNRRTYSRPYHGHLEGSDTGDMIFKMPGYLHAPVTTHDTDRCQVHDPDQLLDGHQLSILQELRLARELTVMQRITSGQSGSAVFLVDITRYDMTDKSIALDGTHFCKIYRTPTGGEQETHELVMKTPIGPYVPKLVDSTPLIDGWMASIYVVAHNRTLQGSQALAQLLMTNAFAARQNILNLLQMLREWNDPFPRHHSHPYDLLRRPFTRFGSENSVTDNLERRIESFIAGLTPEHLYIQFQRQVLPNPVAFTSRRDLWNNARRIAWPIGHVHGDLHSNNIICLTERGKPDSPAYPVIIDFDTYTDKSLIFIDLAYLEIDIAVRMLDPATIDNREDWLKLSSYLAQDITLPTVPPLDPSMMGLNMLLVPIRAMAAELCDQASDDFKVSFWIARTAAGLEFARKRKVSSGQRMISLLIAAQSLGKVLKLFDIEPNDYRRPFWVHWFEASPFRSTPE